jgi:hypothetical protein
MHRYGNGLRRTLPATRRGRGWGRGRTRNQARQGALKTVGFKRAIYQPLAVPCASSTLLQAREAAPASSVVAGSTAGGSTGTGTSSGARRGSSAAGGTPTGRSNIVGESASMARGGAVPVRTLGGSDARLVDFGRTPVTTGVGVRPRGFDAGALCNRGRAELRSPTRGGPDGRLGRPLGRSERPANGRLASAGGRIEPPTRALPRPPPAADCAAGSSSTTSALTTIRSSEMGKGSLWRSRSDALSPDATGSEAEDAGAASEASGGGDGCGSLAGTGRPGGGIEPS